MAVRSWFRAAVVSNRPPPRRHSRQIGRVERFTCVLTRAGRSCPGSDSGRKKVLRDPACHRPFTAISKLRQGHSLLNPRFPPTILVSLTIFDHVDGANPFGLMHHTDGKFYGTTSVGGTSINHRTAKR